MRLSDADQRVCASLQQAYLCSEKKKVRRPDSSMNGSTSASPLAGVAGAVAGAANAEQARRCKVQDRLRKSVQPRTKVLATSSVCAVFIKAKSCVFEFFQKTRVLGGSRGVLITVHR